MQNKKGFTLVELLASVVILGILSAVAIPSIMKVISNNRDKLYRQDAKKMVTLAEVGIRDGTFKKLGKGNCMLILLRNLKTSELNKAPNGGEYINYTSFVFIIRDTNDTDAGMPQYHYYVYLVEKYGKRYRGVDFQEIESDANDIEVKDLASDWYRGAQITKLTTVQIGDLLGFEGCMKDDSYIYKWI